MKGVRGMINYEINTDRQARETQQQRQQREQQQQQQELWIRIELYIVRFEFLEFVLGSCDFQFVVMIDDERTEAHWLIELRIKIDGDKNLNENEQANDKQKSVIGIEFVLSNIVNSIWYVYFTWRAEQVPIEGDILVGKTLRDSIRSLG